MQDRRHTRAGLGLEDIDVPCHLPFKPSHTNVSSGLASLRSSPIRALRTRTRTAQESIEPGWDDVVDESKVRIQGAIDGLRLVLTSLKPSEEPDSPVSNLLLDDAEWMGSPPSCLASTSTESTLSSGTKSCLSGLKTRVVLSTGTFEAKSTHFLTEAKSSNFLSDPKGPTRSSGPRRSSPAARSLMLDMSTAASDAADAHGWDETRSTPCQRRKWRCDTEKSARLGEELQQLIVDQDRRIAELQAQLHQQTLNAQRADSHIVSARLLWEGEREELEVSARKKLEDWKETASRELQVKTSHAALERQQLQASHEEAVVVLKTELEAWKEQTSLWADTGSQLRRLVSQRDAQVYLYMYVFICRCI